MPSITAGETMTGNGGNGMALITIKELGTIYEDDTVGVGKEFHFLYNQNQIFFHRLDNDFLLLNHTTLSHFCILLFDSFHKSYALPQY